MVTLIAEDGTGLANANTYQDRATMAAYHSDRGNLAWAALEPEEQDVWNFRGAEFLDDSYSWRAEIATEGQGRRFPRVGLKDRDGRPIASDVVPTQILRAHAELALLLSQGLGVGGSSGSVSQATGALKRVKADSVEVEWQANANATPAAPVSNALPGGASEMLDRILFGLFVSPNRVMISLGKS